ncbi:MAG: phospholipase D/Transphosphatidylase [Polaromonas sp.]|nr:phospholipase D/Transphosphatidylase [Polaromonas sp.]
MSKWTPGNRIILLENGEAFFPRVFECIAGARHEVVLETFILFEDKVGRALHAALLQAAGRGVRIDMTIDGYGSPDLSDQFLESLTLAGVRVHVFDPAPRLWGMRTNVFRRMHRKIVVIDGERAFVGGINYSADHLADYGPEGKQDYSVEIEGPIVATIHDFVHRALLAGQRNARGIPLANTQPTTAARDNGFLPQRWRHARPSGMPANAAADAAARSRIQGDAQAMFVTRDNRRHTNDIEKHYRIAIRAARHRVVIANAYFFPGYRLLREMRRAARRGVAVNLILQGEPDMPIVKTAASLLYRHLVDAGVHIHEYGDRPLHGKVALSDDEWATVGSSNLDPLSLSLNLEANIIIKDRAFNQHLFERLDHLMVNSCRKVQPADLEQPGFWRTLRSYMVFHLLRRYPSWAGWLPAHMPRITPAYVPSSRAATAVAPETSVAPTPEGGLADSVSRADPV